MYDLNWEVVVFVGRALLLLMIASASSVFFLSPFNLCWLETLEDTGRGRFRPAVDDPGALVWTEVVMMQCCTADVMGWGHVE